MRFARSLREAFPHERYAAITVYPKQSRPLWVVPTLIIGAVSVVLMLV